MSENDLELAAPVLPPIKLEQARRRIAIHCSYCEQSVGDSGGDPRKILFPQWENTNALKSHRAMGIINITVVING